MANVMTVIIKGKAPDIIYNLPEVKWYGNNPIITIPSADVRKLCGDTLIYTKSARVVMNILINECNFNRKDIYWQDIDAFGESVIFKPHKDL